MTLDEFHALPSAAVYQQLKAMDGLVRRSDWPDDIKSFAEGLLGHLIRLKVRHHEHVEKMLASVERMPQNVQAKDFLLSQLAEYTFLSPTQRDKVDDRIAKAVLNKAPDPEPKPALKSTTVSGIEFEFEEGMEPADL